MTFELLMLFYSAVAHGVGDEQPIAKVIQDLRDEMQLLRSGRCITLPCSYTCISSAVLTLCYAMLNADFAARHTEAKSIAFSSVSGAAANQLLEDLHLSEADGFDEAPFETPAG